jgi:hypothetical protein
MLSRGTHTDLHTTTQAENQVKGGFLLNIVVGKSTAILKLLACENQALLVRRNAFLVLNFGLDIVDGITGLNLEGDGLAGDCGELVRKIQREEGRGCDVGKWRSTSRPGCNAALSG